MKLDHMNKMGSLSAWVMDNITAVLKDKQPGQEYFVTLGWTTKDVEPFLFKNAYELN